MHPEWEYRFWTDAESRAFIRTYYPPFLPIYDAYPHGINRADAFRYFVMAHHGGVYVDLDFECLRPLDSLVNGAALVLGREPDAHSAVQPVHDRGLHDIVCNAFLASVPGHPFWDHVTARLADSHHEPGVLDSTGTFFFTRAYNGYAERPQVTLLPSHFLYPISNRDTHRGLTPADIRGQIHPGAYAVHYWDGSWWREATLRSIHQRVRRARGVS
jgi:mannosyltransferase OCH1-like enzyme